MTATAMTKPWSAIRAFYNQIVDAGMPFSSMLELVSRIEESRFAKGLFAWTSMHELCIAQTEAIYPYDGPYPRVSTQPDGKLDCRYIDTYITDHQWHRTVPGPDGFSRLEHFIDQLHRFPRE